MNQGGAMKEVKADAALYLLTILIQRVTKDQPELLDRMIEGVKADQAGVQKNAPNKDHVKAIFDESYRVLKQIKDLGSENS